MWFVEVGLKRYMLTSFRGRRGVVKSHSSSGEAKPKRHGGQNATLVELNYVLGVLVWISCGL